jgi:prophage antirepressor-like protein/phage antirepressor YoqD-like protein
MSLFGPAVIQAPAPIAVAQAARRPSILGRLPQTAPVDEAAMPELRISMSGVDRGTFDFDGTPVRVVMDAVGDPWFVLHDLCAALGIGNPSRAAMRFSATEKGLAACNTRGGTQQLVTLCEDAMYAMILRCQGALEEGSLPYRFRKWVTKSVLPSIRRTGSYSVQPADPAAARDAARTELLNSPTVLRDLLLTYSGQVVALQAEVATLQAEAAVLTTEVAVLAPKAGALDRLTDAAGAFGVREAAKVLKVKQKELVELLLRRRWCHRNAAKNLQAYAPRLESGHLLHRESTYVDRNGTLQIVNQPMVTAKGMSRLAIILEKEAAELAVARLPALA